MTGFEVSSGGVIEGVVLAYNSTGNYGVKVTGLKPGTAICKIAYQYNNAIHATSYTIEVVDLNSIIIPQSLTLNLGDTFTFSPVIQDSRMKNYLLQWQCEDTNIASISTDQKSGNNYVRGGRLEAKNPGTTRVFCTYKGITATCQLTVEPIYVSEINFEEQEYELTAYESLKLEPQILPTDATNKDVTWKSTNPSIAIVDNKGKVVGVNKGKAVITATAADGSMTMGNYTVVVKPEEKDEVDIDFKIDDYAQFSTKIERESPFTLNIQPPSSDWRIESFYINGTNSAGELTNGNYSVDCVSTPMNIEASFAYDGQLKFYDLTTGIESTVENSTINISKSGNQLLITNIPVGANVKIYTVGGMLIGTHDCSLDSLNVELSPNTYIIVIDNLTFKIKI